jgi:hypothetical protein
MVNKVLSTPEGVSNRFLSRENKSISFKQLLAEARSMLHPVKRDAWSVSELPDSPKAPEINPDPAARREEQAVPVSAEPGLSEIDPLELALAPMPVPNAAPHPGSGLGVVAEPRGAFGSLAFETVLLESIVKRVSWGGDRRRGVARLELDGAYAGTTLWVRGEGSALEIEIRLGAGLDSIDLPERLLGRLRARGLEVSAVDVR